MPLTRKARIVGSSLVVTIPSQLAKAHDINDGDEIEIIPTGMAEFKIKKVKKWFWIVILFSSKSNKYLLLFMLYYFLKEPFVF